MMHKYCISVNKDRLLLLLLALVGGAILIGCGTPVDPARKNLVQGKVCFSDGSPLPGGDLHLTYENGQDRYLALNADGTFAARGFPLGIAKVWIDNSYIKKITPLPATGNQAAHEVIPFKYVPVPSKYTNPRETPWTWEITAGTNIRDFVIEKDR